MPDNELIGLLMSLSNQLDSALSLSSPHRKINEAVRHSRAWLRTAIERAAEMPIEVAESEEVALR